MSLKKEALKLHAQLKGKLEVKPKVAITKQNLKLLYTPGVAEVVRAIAKNKKEVYHYTGKGNTIAIISDGSRILGLGNQGPEAALPVMESKALLYKIYGNINAMPLCIQTQKTKDIIALAENISPNFGAINIEDIASPRCFEVVDALAKRLSIPIFHDDQHGTAMVTLAALVNALKVVKKKMKDIRIIILGAGAAGFGIAKLLSYAGARNLRVLDSHGIIYSRRNFLNKYKSYLAHLTNPQQEKGSLEDVLKNADVFIGVSGKKDILSRTMIKSMNKHPIIFALSNPDPEIQPQEARKAGAFIIATGRSDFPNQVNNALVFPFFMRKLLDEQITHLTEKLLYQTALMIAHKVKKQSVDHVIPTIQEMYK